MLSSYRSDIKDITDIQLMVDTFYSKVRNDTTIGPIFNGVIKDNWPIHLERMYKFWQTILLHVPSYSGSPSNQHQSLPIGAEHFEIWLDLFTKTVDENFAGTIAEEAKLRAEKMAEMFQLKLAFLKK